MAKTITSISVFEEPNRKRYVEGEILDLTGMSVVGFFGDGTFTEITKYECNLKGKKLTIDDDLVVISYQGLEDSFPISVIGKNGKVKVKEEISSNVNDDIENEVEELNEETLEIGLEDSEEEIEKDDSFEMEDSQDEVGNDDSFEMEDSQEEVENDDSFEMEDSQEEVENDDSFEIEDSQDEVENDDSFEMEDSQEENDEISENEIEEFDYNVNESEVDDLNKLEGMDSSYFDEDEKDLKENLNDENDDLSLEYLEEPNVDIENNDDTTIENNAGENDSYQEDILDLSFDEFVDGNNELDEIIYEKNLEEDFENSFNNLDDYGFEECLDDVKVIVDDGSKKEDLNEIMPGDSSQKIEEVMEDEIEETESICEEIISGEENNQIIECDTPCDEPSITILNEEITKEDFEKKVNDISKPIEFYFFTDSESKCQKKYDKLKIFEILLFVLLFLFIVFVFVEFLMSL